MKRVGVLRLLRVAIMAVMATSAMVSAPVHAGDVYLVERGDPLRARLLNTARPVMRQQVGGNIEFVVRRLAVMDGWAFGHVKMQRPGGGRINWRRTQFAEALAEGMFEPGSTFFLLRRSNRGWVVHDFAIGPTDVTWDGWRQEYDLPIHLFTD